MRKYRVATRFFLAAVLGLAMAPAARAQSSDLGIPCSEGPQGAKHGDSKNGTNWFSARIAIEINIRKGAESVPIDAVMPPLVPACLDSLLLRFSEWLGSHTQPNTAAKIDCERPRVVFAKAANSEKETTETMEEQANNLFKTAENYRRMGNLERARLCYQQVHMLTPTTRMGHVAIDRLIEVEERMRDTHEESEPAPPMPEGPQSSRDGLIPLGLVELSY